jgi:uncharacterized membrane protein YbhN (UPF0104 family)
LTGSTADHRLRRLERVVRWGALALGVVLFSIAVYFIDFRAAFGTIKHLGVALPLALFFSGLWHLARTWAWAWSFPTAGPEDLTAGPKDPALQSQARLTGERRVSFWRLFRVRLAAEAFSYLTLRGIAGEPLKIVLLGDLVDPRQATAAVALERIAYLIGTTLIVGVGAMLALVGLPLSRTWFRVFRAFAIAAGVIALSTGLVITGRGTYFQSWMMRLDRAFGTSMARGRLMRFVSAVERQMLELVRGNPARLVVLMVATVAAYACMALEAWLILRAAGVVISLNGALAVETFSRVASFASAFIPANLGALEASSLAAAAAVGATAGGAALALARRIRGLFWAGVGLAIYPRRARSARIDVPPHSGNTESRRRHTLLYFPHDGAVTVPPTVRLAGLPLAERVTRPAHRAGYDRLLIWLPEGGGNTTPDPRLDYLLRSMPGVGRCQNRGAVARLAQTFTGLVCS